MANLFQKARQIYSTIAVYNRFFLHSTDEKQECLFLGALENNMIIVDMLYMEFRCNLDETLPKTYGKDHYRRSFRRAVTLQIPTWVERVKIPSAVLRSNV